MILNKKYITIPILGTLIVLAHWVLDPVKKNNFIFDVPHFFSLPIFETSLLYLLAHIFTIVPIVALSFDKKVAYYQKWKNALKAAFIVGCLYWVWDIAKTYEQVWGFNPKYYTVLVGNLPIEEWFFFLTFPWASVFIFECLNKWLPNTAFLRFLTRIDTPLSIGFIGLFIGTGLAFWGHKYTVTTLLVTGFTLLWQFIAGQKKVRVQFYRSLPLMTVAFFIINSIFTGSATAQPIVVYNPEEYIGIRIGTIPLDDFAYNFGLQLAVLALYDFFQYRDKGDYEH